MDKSLVQSVSCSITLEEFIAPGRNGELVFEQLPFNHPLWILYSSGTSGPPKCIVHSGGVRITDTFLAFSFSQLTSSGCCDSSLE